MKVYFSEPPRDVKRSNFALERITDLYNIGFLADDSTVWIDITNFHPSVWALNDRSSLVWTHVSGDPGVVRLNEGRVRWAATYQATQDNPEEDLDLENDFGDIDAANNFTYVVRHYSLDKALTVIDKSTTQQLTNGCYTSDSGITVIDANSYVPMGRKFYDPDNPHNTSFNAPEGTDDWLSSFGAPEEFEKSHAIINGAAFLTNSMSKKRRLAFRHNMNDYHVTLPPDYMRGLVNVKTAVFNELSSMIANQLDQTIEDPGDDD